MLQLVVNNRDTIEAIDVGAVPIAVHPGPGCFHYLPPLGPRDRLKRAPECQPTARFDFEKGNEVAAPGDEVQLDATDPKAVRHDLPALALEIANRLLFTGEATTVAIVSPVVRIAVDAARHAAEDIGRRRLQVIGKPLAGAELRTGSGDPEYIEEEKA